MLFTVTHFIFIPSPWGEFPEQQLPTEQLLWSCLRHCALLKGIMGVTIYLTLRVHLKVKQTIPANWVGLIKYEEVKQSSERIREVIWYRREL